MGAEVPVASRPERSTGRVHATGRNRHVRAAGRDAPLEREERTDRKTVHQLAAHLRCRRTVGSRLSLRTTRIPPIPHQLSPCWIYVRGDIDCSNPCPCAPGSSVSSSCRTASASSAPRSTAPYACGTSRAARSSRPSTVRSRRENLAIVRGGTAVVAGSQGGSVTAWDLSGAQRLGRTFQWNASDMSCSSVPCFTVNPMSTLMATNQADGTIALIDLRTRRSVGTLPARNGPETDALAFFPDGRTLATGGVNGHVTLWDTTRTGGRTDLAPRWAGDLDGRESRRRAHCDSDPRTRERGFSSRSPRPFDGSRAVQPPTRIGHGPRRSLLQPRRPKARCARLLRGTAP